jgi:hypothetical protein
MNCNEIQVIFPIYLECITCSRGLQPLENFKKTLNGYYLDDSCISCRLQQQNTGIFKKEAPPNGITFFDFHAKMIENETEKTKPKKNKKRAKLPKDCGIKEEDIPEHCYFVNYKDYTGFRCGKTHPKHKISKKPWVTLTSRKLTIEEKFQQLLNYIS